MENEKLITELKDCIKWHLSSYNLGDEGKTIKLINIAIKKLQSHGIISWALFPTQKPNKLDVILIQPPIDKMEAAYITIYDESTEITDGYKWAKLSSINKNI